MTTKSKVPNSDSNSNEKENTVTPPITIEGEAPANITFISVHALTVASRLFAALTHDFSRVEAGSGRVNRGIIVAYYAACLVSLDVAYKGARGKTTRRDLWVRCLEGQTWDDLEALVDVLTEPVDAYGSLIINDIIAEGILADKVEEDINDAETLIQLSLLNKANGFQDTHDKFIKIWQNSKLYARQALQYAGIPDIREGGETFETFSEFLTNLKTTVEEVQRSKEYASKNQLANHEQAERRKGVR